MEFSGRAGAGGQCDISCKYSFFFCFMVSSPVKCTDDKFGPLFLPLEANRSDFWHLPSLKYKLSWRFFPFDSPETVAVPWLSNGSVLIDILDIFVWPCAPSKTFWLYCFSASTILRPSTAEAAEFSWCCYWGQRTVWLDPSILSLVRYLSRTRCDG